jgi:hypothetical protein
VVVVKYRTVFEHYLVLAVTNFANAAVSIVHVWHIAKDCPNGVRHVRWLEPRGRYLIEER